MKYLLVIILALITTSFFIGTSFAESATFFDEVKFIQYLDENTALEEVRNGNLDAYYYRITSDRLESFESRKGLDVYESTGGSYSILVNPAESEKFNPFSIRDVRFALNYMVDRKLIVNELMGGYGAPMISYYSPLDPEYLSVIEKLESFNFRYNPAQANEIIDNALRNTGAKKIDGKWTKNNQPIEISIFIRSDDPVRKSIGEILASELEKTGFTVKKDFGDLNKAFVVVYGSDPAEMKWSLYTEGWGRSAFVRYDSVGLGQMYSPWFSNMPGFNDPSYWNYKNQKLDEITQKIYTADFNSKKQREKLIQDAIVEGINESVRIFLASKIDLYVVNERIDGVVNDFGAGVPSRFTPINARGDSNEMTIGVKQIYQGAWNPVMGLSDSYSRHIWDTISDPITFKHPFSGKTFPVRAEWNIDSKGPNGKLELPNDAIIWDPYQQKWVKVANHTTAVSKVTFDFKLSDWHNGQKMDMNDIIYSLYFTIDWGTKTDENDKTFDTEYTPRASQTVQTVKGIKIIDENTLEIYVDYWHFDEGEIADWAAIWSVMPWEVYFAMEEAVKDGSVSFSRSGATSKGVNWLSLIVPNDAKIIQNYIKEFKENTTIPLALNSNQEKPDYFVERYDASIAWIEENNHSVISNGPYVLEGYSPESRTISVNAFSDNSYPYAKGDWSKFEKAKLPKITSIKIPKTITEDEDMTINIETDNVSEIKYFIKDSKGNLVKSDNLTIDKKEFSIIIPNSIISNLGTGGSDIKVFALSEDVLKPDFYTTSFFVTEKNIEKLPEIKPDTKLFEEDLEETLVWVTIPIIIVIITIILLKRRFSN